MDFNKPQNNKKKVEKENNHEINEEKNSILSEDELYDLYMNDDITHVLEVPLYPYDFQLFQGKKRISDETINEWIEDCMYFLEQEPQEMYAVCESGDTKVSVLKTYEDDNKYYYTVDVYKNRYTVEISPQEL